MKGTLQEELPKTWDCLIELFPLRPIRTERIYERVAVLVTRLAVLNRPTKDQSDYLESLSLLVEAYEREHHAIDTSDLDPLDLLKFLMEEHGMTGSDLGRILGSRTLGPAILRGDRELSKAHIQKLSAHFHVNSSVFLRAPASASKSLR